MKSPKWNDKAGQGFSIDTVLEFVRKNIRYISGGVLFLALILMLANFTGQNTGENGNGTEVTEGILTEDGYQVDAIPELNDLIKNYYSAYAAGKTKRIRKFATPVTKNERSYIKMFSKNVDAYENIKCYTKKGLEEGSYFVSVYLDIKFKDVDTLAPGLDFFYVCTNEDGQLYINNLYSQFNLRNKEKELDQNIKAGIDSFEREADVVKLREEVQKKYEEALASDEKLRTMVETTMADAYSSWALEIAGNQGEKEPATDQDTEASQPETEQPKESDTEKPKEPDTEKPSEQPSVQEPADTKETVYALDTVNIRAQAGTDAALVDTIPAGTALTRTGTTADGWSKLDYNGREAYVKSEFVSKQAPSTPADSQAEETPPKSIAEGTRITLTNTVNVRASMGEDADKIGTAFTGETVTVILSYAEGWTKVEWNGMTGFVKTEFLK